MTNEKFLENEPRRFPRLDSESPFEPDSSHVAPVIMADGIVDGWLHRRRVETSYAFTGKLH